MEEVKEVGIIKAADTAATQAADTTKMQVVMDNKPVDTAGPQQTTECHQMSLED